MTDNNPLFDEPKLDEFKTESPLRAFASFDMFGSYMIAKGFRPSLGHLTRYLDAMEKKEGWQFVQLLEAATGVPTIIFRKTAVGHIDPDKEKRAQTLFERQFGKTPLDPAPVVEIPEWTMTVQGRDPEKVIWNRVQWRGQIDKLFDTARERPHHVRVKDFLRREQVTDMSHYYRTASVASVLRLIDMFEAWEAYGLDEAITDDALYTALGKRSLAARVGCKEVTSEPVEVLERMAEELADDLNLDVDRESFDIARKHVAEMVPMPDDVPNELREKAFEFVMERLGVHPKHRHSNLRDFKKSFLNPKGTPISHTRFDEQAAFILGSRYDIIAIRNCIASFNLIKPLYETQPTTGGTPIALSVPGDKLDDPLNPQHYNGRECADIGERLTANGYQILKYCWRLGKKDDPCQELGKALWYLDSEEKLVARTYRYSRIQPIMADIDARDRMAYLLDRTANQSQFTADVARFLWDGYTHETLSELKAMIADHKATLDCGHGLAI